MISKHAGFIDSEVMRELEKQAIAKEPEQGGLVKKASANYEPNHDITEDIIALARGLREQGFPQEARSLESKLFIYKTAETHLYRVFDEDGDDLINFSHSGGDVDIAPAKDGLGKVETIVSQHKKMRDMVAKTPTGKLAGGRPDGVNKSAQVKTAAEWGGTSGAQATMKPAIDPKLPANQTDQQWGQLYNNVNAIVAAIRSEAKWKIGYGLDSSVGDTQKFIITAAGDWALDREIVLVSETGGGLVGKKASIDKVTSPGLEARQALLNHYLNVTGGKATFDEEYPGIFEERSVAAKPHVFASLFSPSKINAVNTDMQVFIRKVISRLARVDFGTPPDPQDKISIRTSMDALWVASDELTDIMSKGTDSYVQGMLVSKLNADVYSSVWGQYRALQERLISIYRGLDKQLKPQPPKTVAIPQAARTNQANAFANRIQRWTQPVVGVPGGAEVAMTLYPSDVKAAIDIFNRILGEASRKKSLAGYIPGLQTAISICNICLPTLPGGWSGKNVEYLLNRLSALPFLPGINKADTFSDFLDVLLKIWKAAKAVTASSHNELLKTAQGALPTPNDLLAGSTTTTPRVRKAPGKSGGKPLWQRLGVPAAEHDLVVTMQKQLLRLSDVLDTLLKDTLLKADDPHILQWRIALSSTGRSAARTEDAIDGVWGPATKTALEAAQAIMRKLGSKSESELKVGPTVSRKHHTNGIEWARANIAVLQSFFTKQGVPGDKPGEAPGGGDVYDRFPGQILSRQVESRDSNPEYEVTYPKAAGVVDVTAGVFAGIPAFWKFISGVVPAIDQDGAAGYTVETWLYLAKWFTQRARFVYNGSEGPEDRKRTLPYVRDSTRFFMFMRRIIHEGLQKGWRGGSVVSAAALIHTVDAVDTAARTGSPGSSGQPGAPGPSMGLSNQIAPGGQTQPGPFHEGVEGGINADVAQFKEFPYTEHFVPYTEKNKEILQKYDRRFSDDFKRAILAAPTGLDMRAFQMWVQGFHTEGPDSNDVNWMLSDIRALRNALIQIANEWSQGANAAGQNATFIDSFFVKHVKPITKLLAQLHRNVESDYQRRASGARAPRGYFGN